MNEQSLMSFEQFKEFARSRNYTELHGYYRLTVISLDVNDKGEPQFNRVEVNEWASYRCKVKIEYAYYPMKSDALEAMRNLVDDSSNRYILSYEIGLYPFGALSDKPFWIHAEQYDRKGNLIQESQCSAHHYHKPGPLGKLLGHHPDNSPWKKGDFVVILHWYFRDRCDYAALGILVDEPMSIKEGYEHYRQTIEELSQQGKPLENWIEETNFGGSDEDEVFVQYGPMDEDQHNFTFRHPLDLIPLPIKLPDATVAELRQWYNDYLKYYNES